MKIKKNKILTAHRPQKTPIKTSFMEILGELTRMTKDDAVVLAAVKILFGAYRIRVAKSLATVRLVNRHNSLRELRRAGSNRRNSAWA